MARIALILVAVAVLTASCARDDEAADGELEGLTVFAAASLTEAFEELAPEATFSFAGSNELAAQIREGAPADVFASADEKNMAKVIDAGLVDGDPADFATNALEIAVPPGNPAGIETFADLAAPGVKLVVCAPEVPCGAATATAARVGGVTLHPVSEESSVTDVLGKVSSGEADAGLVYVTDVIAAGDAVEGIAFDESAAAITTYPIAALAPADASAVASAFVAFITGDAGTAVLASAGFGRPGP